jgi:G3E family GTPase
MTRVHVIAGFLGAGKTTVMKHLLAGRPRDEKVAVVVNDFGEAAIDAALLGEGQDLREIRGACVCCTAPDGFVAAVRELLDHDRILVEPTGLAHPEDLVDTLRRAPFADRIEIAPVVVVVDPKHVTEAAEVADVIVVNRTDLASPEELGAARERIRKLWPGPQRVIETVRGVVPADVLSGHGTLHEHVTEHIHDHGHGHVARSWIWPADVVFSRTRLLAVLRDLPLARAKGLFRTDEGVVELQRAGDAVHEETTAWRRDSRVDLIATEADVLDTADELFDLARLRPDELRARGTTLEVAWDGGSRSFDRAALEALPDGVPDVSARFPKRAGRAAGLLAVLRAAGAPTEGKVVAVARDGYASAPTELAELRDGVLVHSLGDGPLPDEQGGPFRLLVPGDVSCANVKGVVRLAVRPG